MSGKESPTKVGSREFGALLQGLVITAVGVVTLALATGYGPAVFAAVPTVVVSMADVAETRPADGGWWVDEDAAAEGSAAVTRDSFDNASALKLALPSTTAKVYLYHDYPVAERPVDLLHVLEGASYTFAGVNVNFQVEMVFLPHDLSTYGARGSTPCTSAVAWGLSDDPDACYTVIKWEPFVRPSTWQTVDLSQDVAANSTTQSGGWISQKRIGSYAGPGPFIGQTLSTYLAQIASLEVTSMVFGAGSGTPGPTAGWVRDVTFDGVTYTFEPNAAPPAAPPASTTEALAELIESDNHDVESDTRNFQTAGSNGDLTSIDPTLPLSGTFAWSAGADAFVDVYAYSAAVFIGTFPIVNGNVVLTNVDLSHLPAGPHHLVFQGQTSGSLAIIGITVAGSSNELARTGSEVGMAGAAAAALLVLVLGSALVLRRRRAH